MIRKLNHPLAYVIIIVVVLWLAHAWVINRVAEPVVEMVVGGTGK